MLSLNCNEKVVNNISELWNELQILIFKKQTNYSSNVSVFKIVAWRFFVLFFFASHNFTNAFFFADYMSDFPCTSVPSTNVTPIKETQLKDGSDLLNVKKAVVVLTRLPEYKISALRPPTPQQFYSEDDSLSSSDSDMQLEPEDDSCDSDFSLSQNKRKSLKRIAPSHTGRMVINHNNLNGNAMIWTWTSLSLMTSHSFVTIAQVYTFQD